MGRDKENQRRFFFRFHVYSSSRHTVQGPLSNDRPHAWSKVQGHAAKIFCGRCCRRFRKSSCCLGNAVGTIPCDCDVSRMLCRLLNLPQWKLLKNSIDSTGKIIHRQGTSISVILLSDVSNKGSIGEIVKVKRGYARNLLIPRKLAAYVTPENKTKFESILVKAKKDMATMVVPPVIPSIVDDRGVVAAGTTTATA